MARVRTRTLADGTRRWDVHYSDRDRNVSVTFTDPDTAAHYARIVELRHRRCWPLAPLMARTGLSVGQLAKAAGHRSHDLASLSRCGLTDIQADRWASAHSCHPIEVWGWDWITATYPAPLDGEAVA